ncbi:RluA family pseudouridine synthase [Marinomonas balearica]|uniref:Ribosomal large subunit pseudouridine synthase A n=1 Tax=Marinomonas balearica TaxID=491947 RepID=A0A4R6MBU5_9GAMM|nr:RluA family pseudouridine synthase [Marinomonas balearica]TDO98786.1 ribosomal large subunit pseudouridine synthase A [Marinomonas balearica]
MDNLPILDILYEDEWLLVLNKPENCLSVPGRGPEKLDSILHRAELYCGEAFAVHRLDYSTSGLILVAKSLECQKRMYKSFREKEVEKEYLAVVRGHPAGSHGSVRKPLRCDWPNRPRQMICTEWGKDAITEWNPIKAEGENTLLSLSPITGRSHQLRVHMQSLGHSIVGDEFYDDQYSTQDKRLLLHAYRIEFAHPFTSAWVKFVAPCSFLD